MILNYKDKSPKIGKNVFIAPDAWIIGDVELGDNVSVFFGAVLRGDIEPIRIGNDTNIQEQTVIHTSTNKNPVIIGRGVTIGHRATIHGAQVRDYCLIGMGSTLLDDAIIESESIIGANSLIPERKIVEAGSLMIGSPAKVMRQLTEQEKHFLRKSAEHYVDKGKEYLSLLPNL